MCHVVQIYYCHNCVVSLLQQHREPRGRLAMQNEPPSLNNFTFTYTRAKSQKCLEDERDGTNPRKPPAVVHNI